MSLYASIKCGHVLLICTAFSVISIIPGGYIISKKGKLAPCALHSQREVIWKVTNIIS